jgi:ceramide glucosyltransferase
MILPIAKFIEITAITGAVSGIAYNLLCIWSAARLLRERRAAGRGARPTQAVSILKPLKGTDPGMYESFRSHCLQDYPDYEIIFGVSAPDDSAIPLVQQLKTEFPQRTIRLMVCQENLGANTKVSTLAQMILQARCDYVVVNDSDIRVGTNYLNNVCAPLNDKGIGLVTCLYRSVPGPTLGSRLESIGISSDFVPGVLAARTVEGGIRFGLGSTLAFRRSDLDAIGGFELFADYLADDYEIGKRIAGTGLQVRLSEEIVETFLPPYTLAEFWKHQLRWARTIRNSRPWGFLGLIFTFAMPWALFALLGARGAASAWGLLAAAFSVRVLAALVIGRGVLNDRQVHRQMWLIPLRDLFAAFVWLASFGGSTVVWRGARFHLKNGKVVALKS